MHAQGTDTGARELRRPQGADVVWDGLRKSSRCEKKPLAIRERLLG